MLSFKIKHFRLQQQDPALHVSWSVTLIWVWVNFPSSNLIYLWDVWTLNVCWQNLKPPLQMLADVSLHLPRYPANVCCVTAFFTQNPQRTDWLDCQLHWPCSDLNIQSASRGSCRGAKSGTGSVFRPIRGFIKGAGKRLSSSLAFKAAENLKTFRRAGTPAWSVG